MTERIYYFKSMLSECEATVTTCSYDEAKKLHCIELDKTVFFPEGGGQFCDTGTINGIDVVEVKEDKSGRIYHYAKEAIAEGSTAKCCIDFDKRFDRMQQHTGEHILSGLVNKYYGYDNVGFHLGDDVTTLDFSGELTADDIKRIEYLANEVIWKNVAVKSFIPSPDELKELNYRSKKELEGDIRIVEIPGADICACCAPHLESTGQAGIIKIIDFMRHRGGMRITILAGKRALSDYDTKHDDIRALSALFSMKQEDILNAAQKLFDDNKSYREKAIRDQEDLFLKEIEKETGKDIILLFGNDINKVVVKHCIETILKIPAKIAGVLSGNDNDGYNYTIASDMVDLKPLIKLINEKYSGRGGGKSSQINGMVTAKKEQLKELIEGFL